MEKGPHNAEIDLLLELQHGLTRELKRVEDRLAILIPLADAALQDTVEMPIITERMLRLVPPLDEGPDGAA